jgi:hypothetical protein
MLRRTFLKLLGITPVALALRKIPLEEIVPEAVDIEEDVSIEPELLAEEAPRPAEAASGTVEITATDLRIDSNYNVVWGSIDRPTYIRRPGCDVIMSFLGDPPFNAGDYVDVAVDVRGPVGYLLKGFFIHSISTDLARSPHVTHVTGEADAIDMIGEIA